MFGTTDCSTNRHGESALRPTELGRVNPILVSAFKHLSRVGRRDLEAISAASVSQLVPPAHVFYQQGHAADEIYILLDGAVHLEHRSGGAAIARLHIVGPYVSFGDRVLLGETVRYFTARAACCSLIVRLPAAMVADTMALYPQVRDAWISDILVGPHRRPAAGNDARPRTVTERFLGFFNAA